jgi:hypothetical protein
MKNAPRTLGVNEVLNCMDESATFKFTIASKCTAW